LDHGRDAMACGFVDAVAKRKERIRSQHRTATGNCARIAPIFTESTRDICPAPTPPFVRLARRRSRLTSCACKQSTQSKRANLLVSRLSRGDDFELLRIKLVIVGVWTSMPPLIC
jgi:hypothetical protein